MSPLTAYREQLNLTQEELATKSGISVRTIQRIESGIKPKGYTLETLSKTLGINKDALLTEQNESTISNKKLIKHINLFLNFINDSSFWKYYNAFNNYVLEKRIQYIVKTNS
jgi:transcriptional regulator with XRE-family HTH domain